MIIKYETPYLEWENCVIKIQSYIPLLASNYYFIIKVKRLPVFEPNDYFFQHH